MIRNAFKTVLTQIGNSNSRLRNVMTCTSSKSPFVKKTNMLDLEMERLVWIDMEMTGLDIDNDKIMEIACLVTDSELNIIAESENIIIHQPNEVLLKMNDWCIKQHGKTGLTEACRNSKISTQEAEDKLLNFLKDFVSEQASPLCGNSVYMDRFFLIKNMPKLNEYLHYRIVDVSSIKELSKRWNNSVYKNAPKKEFTHRALNDIKESVNELKYYKENLFK
ncbi:oligoribonuclease isoform X1 [Anthonomus grandis grandis]|uniref:oligoribonuclease isoform X1 n=2 Tax=Anthonomus grandis grandis TaxID=2921223 RepID=UPI0021657E94|nr:oligoribonuclease isoform X1 [Anthonomus grandis grandis]